MDGTHNVDGPDTDNVSDTLAVKDDDDANVQVVNNDLPRKPSDMTQASSSGSLNNNNDVYGTTKKYEELDYD